MRAACVLVCVVTSGAVAQTFGGFSAERGGDLALLDGPLVTQLRTEVDDAFPNSTVIGAPALTPEFLQGVDALLISIVGAGDEAIEPLTDAEQTALVEFVTSGGIAIIFTDNATFDGNDSVVANESVLAPFGLAATGIVNGTSLVSVSDPEAHPLTSGPFGIVNAFEMYWSGWYSETGEAHVLGEHPSNLPALATLDLGAGVAVFVGDSSLLVDGYLDNHPGNVALVLNGLALAGACPADVNGDGVLNILDFVAYQGLFVVQDPGADCDGNGLLNILDFVCFQAVFAAGCP